MRFKLKNRSSAYGTPVEASKTRDKLRECPVSKLPNEILLGIFYNLKPNTSISRTAHSNLYGDLLRASLVCKAWNNPATCVYYESIKLHTISGILSFHLTLQKYPHLRKLVKDLVFPARFGLRCPDKLMDNFAGIVDLVDSLDSLSITCSLTKPTRSGATGTDTMPRLALPIKKGRHPRLKNLVIYAEERMPSLFPATMTASFSRLTELSLIGVFLAERLSANSIPILQELYHFTSTAGNAVFCMDEWLLACPRLRILWFAQGELPPSKLLANGQIVQMNIHQNRNSSIHVWLPVCPSVRKVVAPWHTFSKIESSRILPSLHDLDLLVYPQDQISLDALRMSLESCPTLKSLGILVRGLHKWLIENREAVGALCRGLGIRFVLTVISNENGKGDSRHLSFISGFKHALHKRGSGYDKDMLAWEKGKHYG